MKNGFIYIMILLFALSILNVKVYAAESDVVGNVSENEETMSAEDLLQHVLDNSSNEMIKSYRKADYYCGELLNEYVVADCDYRVLALSYEVEDRTKAMYKMIELYPEVSEAVRENWSVYLDSYAKYTGNVDLITKWNEIKSSYDTMVIPCAISGYNASSAVNYALAYALGHNTNYPRITDYDCANFVSQCLYAGGMMMNSSWYIREKSGVHYSGHSHVYTSNTVGNDWEISIWTSASQLRNYLVNLGNSSLMYTPNEYYSFIRGDINLGCQAGDILAFYESNGFWNDINHIVILTGMYTNTDGYDYHCFSGHTNDRRNISLADLEGSIKSTYSYLEFIDITP